MRIKKRDILMKREIKLKIHEESDLFSPYDPDQMQLSEDMVTYLKRKSEMMYKKKRKHIRFISSVIRP